MSGREVKEYTNLSDPKGATFVSGVDFIARVSRLSFVYLFLIADRKLGKGGKIDDEDVTFQRMVAKVSASPSPLLTPPSIDMHRELILSLCCIKSLSLSKYRCRSSNLCIKSFE